MSQALNKHTYYVRGMHCAACELLLERKLLNLPEIKSVDASTAGGQVEIECAGVRPSVKRLNELFKKDKYQFSDERSFAVRARRVPGFGFSLALALVIIAVFIGLAKLGVAGLSTVTVASSLPAFFVFGIIAGLSTCAALVGGIVLSMSKQWSELYAPEAKTKTKLTPHLLFNSGRLLSYFIFGAVLGWLGEGLQLSLTTTSILVLGVSVLMVILALQMLGVSALSGWQFRLPKRWTHLAADENNFRGRLMPGLMGAATFFLPCGFTLAAQGLALISGSPLQGGLIMLAFALGTTPILLMIGLASVRLTAQPHRAAQFSKVAGILVLFFALYNINAQLGVLGIPTVQTWHWFLSPGQAASEADGIQVIKMNASSRGYEPNKFVVKAGVPVRWEITDTGTSGCTNAVISRGLFNGAIQLTPGQTVMKEFTPIKTGRYLFSCWMGMVSGVIEVADFGVEIKAPAGNSATDKAREIFGPNTPLYFNK